MRRKPTVVYFTRVELSVGESGGSLCCLNHVRRIAANADLDVTVCVANMRSDGERAAPLVQGLGAAFRLIELRNTNPAKNSRSLFEWTGRKWPILFEEQAILCPTVDEQFQSILEEIAPDLVILDYVPSALFVPSLYRYPAKRITITLNNEAAYYRGLIKDGKLPSDASPSMVAWLRTYLFERWIYNHSDAVVALTESDLPAGLRSLRKFVIPPAFHPKTDHQWVYRGSKVIVFVGNIVHPPNYHAVRWLATRLAPALEATGSDINVHIIGAAESSVDAGWRRNNITYLGLSDAAGVANEFANADLFIAPIENAFGSKIKLLDCLSHGTPFIASRAATSGLPFLSKVALLNLEDPENCAQSIARMLDTPDELMSLSRRQRGDLIDWLSKQQEVWHDVILQTMNGFPSRHAN